MKRSSRQIQFPGLRRGFQRCVAAMLFSAFALLTPGCNSKPNVETKSASTLSAIKVEVRDGGPVIITTSAAEFQALPSGYLQATLLKDGKRATLDDPEAGSATGSYLVHDGKDLEFIPDFSQTKVTEATGKLAVVNASRFPPSLLRPRVWRYNARRWSRCTTIFRAWL